jgi:hypothetical protein
MLQKKSKINLNLAPYSSMKCHEEHLMGLQLSKTFENLVHQISQRSNGGFK